MGKSYSTVEEKKKVVLAMVALTKEDNIEDDLYELKNLAEADNCEIVGKVFQNKDKPDPKFLLGTGKVEELKEMVNKVNADMVIFDNQLSGSKINNLEEYLGCKVIDRAMLILDIFASRALSNEGKLQVELAQLKYTLPRLSGMSGTSGRYGSGGIGMRGPGETKIELDRREIERKIFEKTKELKKLKKERDLRREKRVLSNKPLVALVGYTNSGKSTLLNTITKANVLAKDMLFATLDTTTRSLWLGYKKEIMIVDTVGFVNKLPHELVEAFSSTLEEAVYADLLVHVVDISNSEYKTQEQVVLKVLNKLGAGDKPIITVYNKCDKISEDKMKETDKIYLSAKNNVNIDALKKKIEEHLFPNQEDFF